MELQNSSIVMSDTEYHVKVLVIGDSLVGKSDFITLFLDYETPYETLIGHTKSIQVNYVSKLLNNLKSRPGDIFRFHIWEISDFDENRELIKTYIKNTQIVMLCFSLKNPDSLESLKYWLCEQKTNVHYVLIGLKSNQNNKINQSDIQKFYETYNLDYYEFRDKNFGSSLNIHKPFTKFLNNIYPKANIVIERINTSMINNIIGYCSIL
jgi:GTPase SAR1 family protein